MHLTKFEVLISHDGTIDTAALQGTIEHALGQHIEEARQAALVEVQHIETVEVSLGVIDYAIHEGDLVATRIGGATPPVDPSAPGPTLVK